MSVTDRLDELKSAYEGLEAKSSDIVSSFEIKKNTEKGEDQPETTVHVDPAALAAYREVVAEQKELKGLIETEEDSIGLKRWASRPAQTESAAAAANAGYPVQAKASNLGQAFVNSDEFKQFQATGLYTMQQGWEVQAPLVKGLMFDPETKDVHTATVTAVTPLGFGDVQRDPLVGTPQRTVRVRDLFPAAATNSNLIDYFRTTGFEAANAASTVGERDGSAFELKPQTSLSFEARSAAVRTIAHWEVAHRNVIADEPQLQNIINTELLYGLRLEEDNQILNGAGTGEDLDGLLNDAARQVYSETGSDTKIDAIRKGITKVLLAHYEPTGLVLHPNDWQDIELIKDSQNNYIATVSVAVGAVNSLWRLPVVATPAITEGTALAGAFGLGAQLYDRETSNIRIAEQHSDFFVRNAVVVLAEQRVAMVIKRPESFVDITFA